MTGAWMAILLMTVGLLYYVFFLDEEPAPATEKTRLSFLRERKDVVYENLRDLNFELSAGKMAEPDYQSLRSSLEHEAAAILSEIDRLEKAQGGGA